MIDQSLSPPLRGRAQLGAQAQARRRERLEARARIRYYLDDPFLARLYDEAMSAGRFTPITLDLTHVCQLRCEGCYFFSEQLDESKAPREEELFDDFVRSERARGTNFVTVLGGEPSLQLGRLKTLYDNFRCIAVTNGLRKIPYEGFETLGVAVSVWGDHELDTQLRGGGKVDVFARALKHYRDDPRVTFYFTVSNANVEGIERAVDEIAANGNLVSFSFYEDRAGLGGEFDQRRGYSRALHEICRMIDKHPSQILSTAYTAQVASGHEMLGLTWDHATCPVVSSGYNPEKDKWYGSNLWLRKNGERIHNGQPYYPNHRAVMPDLKSVRRCAVGEQSDCATCHNAYARSIWIMLNWSLHAGSKQHFTNWLTTAWVFALGAGALDVREGRGLLPEIHERTRSARRGM